MILSRYFAIPALFLFQLTLSPGGPTSSLASPDTVPPMISVGEIMLEIGSEEDDPSYQLYRAWDARFQSDGSIVVGNSGTGELRAFSADGQLRWVSGREGEGPGEFREITSVLMGPQDSIWVLDARARRVSKFGPDGRFVDDRRVTIPSRFPELGTLGSVARLNPGRWVGGEEESVLQGQPGTLPQDTIEFGFLDGDLQWVGSFASIPARITTLMSFYGQVLARTAAFSPSPSFDTHGECVFLTSGINPLVSIYDASGELVDSIVISRRVRMASPEDLESWIEVNVKGLPEEEQPVARQLLDGAPRPSEIPLFNDLIVDSQGLLWLQDYSPPLGYGDTWTVLGPSADSPGRVRFPGTMRVLDIMADRVLAFRRNQFDEEVLVVYRISRHGQSTSPATWSRCF